MEQTHPSFGERIAELKHAAETLRAIAELIMLEAQRMDAAQTRFAARKGKAGK